MVEVGLITVIRRTGEDRFGAVELFERDQQRKLVLEFLREPAPNTRDLHQA